jgi:hypothetical protein
MGRRYTHAMMARPVLKVALVGLLMVLVPIGCAKKKVPGSNSSLTPSARARPSTTGQLGIVEPAAGATVAAGTVHVKLTLSGARIVAATSQNLKPDEGHVHLSLDDKLVSMTSTLEEDIEVSAGSHILQAEFVASDHAPFNPRMVKTVTFKAQ